MQNFDIIRHFSLKVTLIVLKVYSVNEIKILV